MIDLIASLACAWVIYDLLSGILGQRQPAKKNPSRTFIEWKLLQDEKDQWVRQHRKWWQSPNNKHLLRDYQVWVNTGRPQE
jgi:hypothetical protein